MGLKIMGMLRLDLTNGWIFAKGWGLKDESLLLMR